MTGLEPLRADHADALLRFERDNLEYFARSISDRGDAYFEQFARSVTSTPSPTRKPARRLFRARRRRWRGHRPV